MSVVDPELRVGHKSARQQWAGYKVQVAEEPTSELLTAVEVRPANEHDAAAAVDLITGQAERVGLRPPAILGDGAYGTADVRAELGAAGVEVVAKLRAPTDGEHFGKDAFVIDLAANDGRGSVTCPAGETTTDLPDGARQPPPAGPALPLPAGRLQRLPAARALPGGADRPAAAPAGWPAGAAALPRGDAPGGAGGAADPGAAAGAEGAAAATGQDRAQDRRTAAPARAAARAATSGGPRRSCRRR